VENEFLTDLFGDQEGIVYSPVLSDTVNRKNWKQYFFEWPAERDKLESHISDFNTRDVYISPVLFNERRIAPETFKGTNYLWTEFDGVLPNEPIQPTMRVMSSQEGHEHWYWKLDSFVTDKVMLEDLTRRIAYHYGADLSVWDYQNVLRPVGTWNHKRNKPVTLLSRADNVYSVDEFLWVPIPPVGTKVDVKLGELPHRDAVLAKYKWQIDTLDLIFKDVVPVGKRSDALMRLAFDAIEAGCSNEEVYVIIEERDSVWGKYVGRNDREKRLETTIARARAKKAVSAEITNTAPEVYRFYDFMKTNVTLKWAIEGLLPVAGSMVIFGKPGIGKTTFSLRLAMDLSLGKENFLLWKIVNRQRVLFVSLEMQHYEVKEFFKDMEIPEDEQQQLQEQFFVWPIGNAYPFDTPDQQLELLKYIRMHKIELVIIDSLSLSMYGSVKDDDAIKRLNSFLNEDVRKDLKCSYIFIHHPRKKGNDEQRKVDDQDDSFGSTYISANAQTVVVLSQKPGSPRISVKLLKSRMSMGMKDFEIERTPDRGYKLVGAGSTLAIEQRETSSTQKESDSSLGKLWDI
jgi:archaellum biogenesis ATPase FlaH